MGFTRSLFRDTESYLRIVVGSDENYIQLKLKQYISNFDTFEIHLDLFSVKDISEVVYTKGDHEGPLRIEKDEFSIKKTYFDSFKWDFWNVRI